MVMPLTDKQINEWYEGFKQAIRTKADIDITKPEDMGRIRIFAKTGEETITDKNTGEDYQSDVGEMRYACLPQNGSGYTGVPKEGMTDEWLLANQKEKTSVSEKRALYEKARQGYLFVRDLNGEFYQTAAGDDGKTSIAPMVNKVLAVEPKAPQPPKEPTPPNAWRRFCHAIMKRAYAPEFETYEHQRVLYEEKKAFYEKQEKPNYTRAKREYDLSRARETADYNYSVVGVGSEGMKIRADRLHDIDLWAKNHYKISELDKLVRQQESVKGSYEKMLSDAARIDRRVEKVMGPRFEHLPELVGNPEPVYDPAKFNPPSFDENVVSKCAITPLEIGYVTMAAYADPAVSGIEDVNKNKCGQLATGVQCYYMGVDGVITNYRKGVGNDYGKGLKEARVRSEAALKEYYVNGNPAPLGKLLATGIRMQESEVRSAEQTAGYLSQFSHICRKITELVDKHPDLKDAAVKYGGLTEDELTVARGLGQVEIIQKEGMMAQDMLLGHAINTIDPTRGKQLPTVGSLNLETNYKAVQRMQAVNYAVSSNLVEYHQSAEFEQRKKQYLKEFQTTDKNAQRIAMGKLETMDNSAPLCSVFAPLGVQNGAQSLLNNTRLGVQDAGNLNGRGGVRGQVELITAQARLTEKMPEIVNLLAKGAPLEMPKVREFSANIAAKQVQPGMQI
jgi:hypothetical protein